MDYEKEYKEALDKAKEYRQHLYDVGLNDYAEKIEDIFPLLKEADDEEIRQMLIAFVKTGVPIAYEKNIQDAIRWLERQKKSEETNKPVEWSEQDVNMLNGAIHLVELDARSAEYVGKAKISDVLNWLKSLNPQVKQNDYDRGYRDGASAEKYNQWKPNPNQMAALVCALNSFRGSTGVFDEVNSLYEDLRKLQNEK